MKIRIESAGDVFFAQILITFSKKCTWIRRKRIRVVNMQCESKKVHDYNFFAIFFQAKYISVKFLPLCCEYGRRKQFKMFSSPVFVLHCHSVRASMKLISVTTDDNCCYD